MEKSAEIISPGKGISKSSARIASGEQMESGLSEEDMGLLGEILSYRVRALRDLEGDSRESHSRRGSGIPG